MTSVNAIHVPDTPESDDEQQEVARLISGAVRTEAEERLLSTLRPKTLDEFIGQHNLKLRLSISLQAAQIRQKTLDHALFSGPPGLGKTTLARIIAEEMHGNLVESSGPALEKTADLVGLLTSLDTNDVFFIDEIHRLPKQLEEVLYPAMEDYRVDFVIGDGLSARTYPMPIKPFTLIGATTRKGMLSGPLKHRFGLDFNLSFYNTDELALIVQRSALLLDVKIMERAAEDIARRSRGTPRIANRLLRRVQDHAVVSGDPVVTVGLVNKALSIEGIDGLGMDELDREYLKTLSKVYHGGPAGVSAIAASMRQEPDTLIDDVEPFLLHQGIIVRSPAGRRLTEKGEEIAP